MTIAPGIATALTIASTIASAGLGLAGANMQAKGALLEGQAANRAAQYRAAVARMNADIAQQNANRTIERSQVEQQDQDIAARAFMGEQLAAQGASGLSLGGPSQIMTRKAARRLAILDAQRIRQGGELEAYGHLTEKANLVAAGRAAAAEGRHALEMGRLGARTAQIGGFQGLANSLVTAAGRVRSPSRFTRGSIYTPFPRPRPQGLLT